jgi:diketogulonate reductase-like aldo/keto reductase
LGGTHLDAANDYRTQTSIGAALKNTPQYRREEVFLTTKCPGAIGYQGIIQCADDNLQMLGQFTDQGPGYIDLLLVHFPFTIKPMCRFNSSSAECQSTPFTTATKEQLQDTWRGMEELKRIGVVRSIGISDYDITQIQQTLETAKVPIELNQVEWNPAHHNESMLAFCKEHGIQLQAWSPLGGAEGSVLSNPIVKGIAAKHNVSTAQVALRWSLQRGVAVVVGTANPAHVKSDLELFGFQLADEEVASISALHKGQQASFFA